MRWRRKPSTGQLERWLTTGEPAWVERWVDDPDVTEELERLTVLSAAHVSMLHSATSPSEGFEQRTVIRVRERADDLERVEVLFGLLGLGPRVARSLIEGDDH